MNPTDTCILAHEACGRSGRPVASVVIPCHNYARFLPQCLESLLCQGLDPAGLEVVFVDDASSDGALGVAASLLGAMPFGFWQTLALRRVGRPGPVRNAGLSVARGEHLLCLDPDDQLLPGYVPRCLEALAQGRADVAYTGYFEEQDGVRREVLPPDYHPLLLANQNILHSAALLHRRVWERGARYRSATAYEDWDFWVQAALQEARFVRVAERLFVYRQHGQGYSRRARAEDGQAKARIVLDNQAFFPPWTRAWARALQRGEAWARPQARGIIPVLREHTDLPLERGAAARPGPRGASPLPAAPAQP